MFDRDAHERLDQAAVFYLAGDGLRCLDDSGDVELCDRGVKDFGEQRRPWLVTYIPHVEDTIWREFRR
jgi:hypothetical protein